MTGDLFNPRTIRRLCKDVEITKKQKESANEWLVLLQNDEFKKDLEKSNYPIFQEIILGSILGFSMKNVAFEKNNVEYQYPKKNSILCIEAKKPTQDLFAMQDRKKEHATPIKQTWDYIGNIEGLEYGVCTNYQKFVLITKQYGYSKYYEFDFKKIWDSNKKQIDEQKLKEFVGIFARERFDSGFVKNLSEQSIIEEKDFTKEFYKLFHETRLILIESFQEKENVSKSEATYYAQIFLNRLIFIFFVEDKGFLKHNKIFYDRIKDCLIRPNSHSRKACDDIKELFRIFDKGDESLQIFGFNGGLFSGRIPDKIYFNDLKNKHLFEKIWQHSDLLQPTAIPAHIKEIMKKNMDLNPIISNLLIMDSYDFNTEVSVNILGHIFEQSISDLEELQKKGISTRKKDGVYYTSEYITDHLCRSTIISYLSKSGEITDAHDLVHEYIDDIEILEQKFEEIKVIDIACGSGAFLVQSANVLLDIYKAIQEYKESAGKYSGLDKWNEEEKIKTIIENNIYGVDINEQSVEITKLSLFFRLASSTRRLPNLSKNIKVGNSLILDKNVDSNAFDWEKEFPEIFNPLLDKIGFDVVIGNPPWETLKQDRDEFFSPLYNDGKMYFSKLDKNKKNAFMEKCLDDPGIQKRYKKYKLSYKKQTDYFATSSDYVHQSAIVNGKKQPRDSNLYKLFTEKSFHVLTNGGYCGLVLPSGIYSDMGSRGLREMLFDHTKTRSLYGFINKKGIFEDVHRQFKFCTLVFEKGKTTDKFSTSFYLEDVTKLQTLKNNAFWFDVEFIKSNLPTSISIIECSNKDEFHIIKKLFKHTLLGNKLWNLSIEIEFNMTIHNYLFHTTNIGLPLYEGKMINSFCHNYALPRYWIDENDGRSLLKKRVDITTKKSIKYDDIELNYENYRLVYRKLTNATNERTLIATILPPNVFVGDSLNCIIPIKFNGKKYIKTISYDEMIFLCGVFNSFVVDFIPRHRIATNLNIFHMKDMPIPRYDADNKFHKKIFVNSAKLICTSHEYSNLCNSIGIQNGIIDPNARLGLEAQINANVAKIYDLSRKELELILMNFPLVDQKLKDETINEFNLLDISA